MDAPRESPTRARMARAALTEAVGYLTVGIYIGILKGAEIREWWRHTALRAPLRRLLLGVGLLVIFALWCWWGISRFGLPGM